MLKTLIFSFFIFCFCLFSFDSQLLAIESKELLFQKALLASRQGDFVDAINKWDDYLILFPEDAIALSNRGNVRLALGDPEGDILDQTYAINLLPLEIDPHLNRGIAEEALGQWNEAINDYTWILERDSSNFSALYNLGNVMISKKNWLQAKFLFNKASLANPGFEMARSSKALADYQLNHFEDAEKELRSLIRKYPMFADARAALSALLWRKGYTGEAESHWAAASGIDSRYSQKDWLLTVRRWPPEPVRDLMSLLELKKR